MESFREGVQCEPFLLDVSIGILPVGAQQESLSEGVCWNSPVICQRSATAMPHQCQSDPNPMPMHCH
eukprot:818920-Pyramimonas_sp.AAC.1